MKTYQKYFCFVITTLILFSLKPEFVHAQQMDSIGNGYYISYPGQWMASLYLSRKFAPFTIQSAIREEELNYKTNSKLDLGASLSYRSLSLSLSYGFHSLIKKKGRERLPV